MRVAVRIFIALVWLTSLAVSGAKAADYHHVIFIPGTMGSRLVNADGDLVWGTIGATQLRFEQLAYPLDPSKDTLRPDGLLKDVKLYFGWFKVQAYGPMSDFLTRTVAADHYHEFAYNWRQSNFKTACDLVKYIGGKSALARAAKSDDGITLVTHSMGGIVGRTFISYRAPSGTPKSATNPCPHQYNVTLFLPIAAPFVGAGQALKTFTEGMANYWKLIRFSNSTISRVFFSIPSVYELLPRYAKCCMATVGGQPSAVDLFALSEWNAYGWIPTADVEEFRTPQFKAFMQQRLDATKRLAKILGAPLPSATQLFSISGYNQPTSTFVKLQRGGTNTWTEAPDGDDTVPEVSSIPPRGLERWRVPNTHVGLMADERVHKLVKLALDKFGSTVIGPRSLPEDGSEADIPEDLRPYLMTGVSAKTIDDVGLYKISFRDLPPSFAGDSKQEIHFTANDASGAPLPSSKADDIEVTIETGDGAKVSAEVEADGNGMFTISFRTPKAPDVCSILVALPQDGAEVQSRAEEMFAVADAQ